jgi:dTDP-glucose pyrophosphorylase
MRQLDVDDVSVLIPAAGRVPEGVLAFSNITCPAMIPVAGRPLIYWTLRYLLSLGLRRFIIAVARRQVFLEDFVACTFGKTCSVRFVVPAEGHGLGGTVRELSLTAESRRALVVLGDTHFQFDDPSLITNQDATMLTSEVDDPYRWCTVETDDSGIISRFYDKSAVAPVPAQALIGVYYFPDLEAVRRASQAAVDAADAEGRPTEMADVLRRLPGPLRTAPAGEWLDCGNPDRQAASHQVLLQKRAFNDLAVNSVLGTITKRSRHVDKFLDEINYLRLLPSDIAVLFPRVVDYSTQWDNAYLTMEYYGYPTLSEVLVFENVDPGIWEQVFLHLRAILLNEFSKHRKPVTAPTLKEMYLEKTRERLRQIEQHSLLGRLSQSAEVVVINKKPLANICRLWPKLEEAINRLSSTALGTLVHGDLCFSNILYDLRCRICKFIDPRGSFGSPGVFGDLRYDVAKMYHSVYGLYDLIINDLFEVEVGEGEITLDIRARPQHGRICERFERVFFEHFDRSEILLLTGLLFASMPALHYDVPKRQAAMYARGVQLLNEALSLENGLVGDCASL